MKVETLLRPVPEYFSAIVSFGLAFYMFFFSNQAFILPVIAVPVAIFFLAWGLKRFWEATKIKFYQQHLMSSPRFVSKLSKIPKLKSKDYYGKGFIWTAKHLSRLEESLAIDNEKYVKLNWRIRLNKALSVFFQKNNLDRLDALVNYESAFNPIRPMPDLGGKPQLHGVGLYEAEKDVYEDITERFGHRKIDGTTRAGKTTAARVMIWQDIHRGMPVIIFDPKGDSDLLESTYAAAKAAGKEDKFVFFHLGFPEESARYTPFADIARMTEVATITTSALPNFGNAASFKEFAWRFVNSIQITMSPMGERPTYKKILEYAKNIDLLFVKYCDYLAEKKDAEYPEAKQTFRSELETYEKNSNKGQQDRIEKQWNTKAIAWIRAIKTLDAQVPDWKDETLSSLMSIMEHEKSHFQKLVNSLYPLLEKLCTGAVGDLLSPDYEDFEDTRSILDFRSAIKENKIVYCGFDALADTTIAGAVSVAMLSDLVSTAGEIYKHGTTPGVPEKFREGIKPISLYVDEAAEIIGEPFVPLINKGGGAGIQTTMLSQASASDAEVRMGSRAAATQTLSNFNTQIVFRVRTEDTAMSFCNQLGTVTYNQTMVFSGATDSPDPSSKVDFVSSTQHRTAAKEVPLLSPEHLINLPKGHSFVSTNGRLYKVRWPYTTIDKDLLPESIKDISRTMDKNYESSNNWFVDSWYMAKVLDMSEDEISNHKKLVDNRETKNDLFFGHAATGMNDTALNVLDIDGMGD